MQGQGQEQGQAGSELVEVVDEHGQVTSLVDRATMRKKNLRHRCTYVAMVAGDELSLPKTESPLDGTPLDETPLGESPLDAVSLDAVSLDAVSLDETSLVVVHQRAHWKDLNPGFWDVAFGGVCAPGESWAVSARRELMEESGVSDFDLVELGLATYADADTDVVGMVYLAGRPAGLEGVAVDADGEVVAVDVVPLGDLAAWSLDIAVCPDSAAIVIPWLLRLGTTKTDF